MKTLKKEIWSDLLYPLVLIIGLGIILNVDVDTAQEITVAPKSSEGSIQEVVGYLGAVAELAAGIIVTVAVARGLWDYLSYLFSHRKRHFEALESIRLQLGRGLTLGLEFTVASDILQTAVAPTRRDIINLGAIVLLRTLLNYFLEREIRQGERENELPNSPDNAPP